VDFVKQPVTDDAKNVINQIQFIDERIHQAAPEFPIDKINKIDLAILRLAIYELLIERKEPQNVIIDEAIELSKEFSGDTSPAFINGALGNIVRHEKDTGIQK
jgi:transcription antitermination protein NusB